MGKDERDARRAADRDDEATRRIGDHGLVRVPTTSTRAGSGAVVLASVILSGECWAVTGDANVRQS